MSRSSRNILKNQNLIFYSAVGIGLFFAVFLVQWVIFPSTSHEPQVKYQEPIDLPSDQVTPQDVFVHQTKNDQIIMKKQIEFLQEQLMQGEAKASNQEKEKMQLRFEMEELRSLIKNISTEKLSAEENLYSETPFSSDTLPIKEFIPLKCLEIEEEQNSRIRVGEIIPAGTSLKVKLLSGVEAICSSDATNDPIPVKLRSIDYAYLPKHLRINLKGAYFIGSAYGSLSTERVIIRLERMSLIYDTGEEIETEIAAWVTGEDGIYGVKGELYRNTRKIMTNAVTSGIISEAGDITKNVLLNSTSRKTKNRNETSVLIGDNFGQTTSGRTSNSFDMLSEEYMNEAREIKPVVKVESGRTVDITFSIGVKLGEKHTKDKIKNIREKSRLREASLGK